MSNTNKLSFHEVVSNVREECSVQFLNTIEDCAQREVFKLVIDNFTKYKIWLAVGVFADVSEISAHILNCTQSFGRAMSTQSILSARKNGFSSPTSFITSKLKEGDSKFANLYNQEVFFETAIELCLLEYIKNGFDCDYDAGMVDRLNIDADDLYDESSKVVATVLAAEFCEAVNDFLKNSKSGYAQLFRFFSSKYESCEARRVEPIVCTLISILGGVDRLFCHSDNSQELKIATANFLDSLNPLQWRDVVFAIEQYVIMHENSILSQAGITQGGLVEFLLEKGYKFDDVVECLVGDASEGDNIQSIIIELVSLVNTDLLNQISKFVESKE